jgi:cytidylate kinase
MTMIRQICAVCAWRGECQKRYIEGNDSYTLYCPDYTRDVTIKEDIDSKLLDYQLGKWEGRQPKKGPVITISRETGSGGTRIARVLANDLKMDLIGSQLISKVAVSAKMSAKVVETLDEKAITALDSWIDSLFVAHQLWPDVYLKHLTKVIAAIGKHGNVIVVGRGAHLILPKEDTFKLRFIAPIETRILRIMENRKLDAQTAEQFIIKRDMERRGFIKKYFHADIADPAYYDMVINTDTVGIEGAIEAVKDAFAEWRKASHHHAANRTIAEKQ